LLHFFCYTSVTTAIFYQILLHLTQECPMSMQLIDGKEIARHIRQQLLEQVTQLTSSGQRPPHLVAVLVGNDGGSRTYVAHKMKACQEVGFRSSVYEYPDSISEDELLEVVNSLNEDKEVDGFIVQLPLPRHVRVDRIMEQIDYKKDVDGFHPVNVGRMMKGLPAFVSATPLGIVQLLEKSGISTSGKHCVVIGRSQIVGAPVSVLMYRNAEPGNCTVTVCHSKTHDLPSITRQADILIAAIGIPEYVKADMVKEGAIVIDVGTTRVEDATKKQGWVLKGDVKFDEVAPKCSFITPVPGGVGPMTIAGLLQNTLKAATGEIYLR
jgi:methylenetetrahydrofolate dehydrogenase (NADP+)/methenyltetrahydrofolate cyclohydrolase